MLCAQYSQKNAFPQRRKAVMFALSSSEAFIPKDPNRSKITVLHHLNG